MRIKRMAGTVAAGTLAMTGLGIVGATAAHADAVRAGCGSTYHQAELFGGGREECFKYNGSGDSWIEVDGWALICATDPNGILAWPTGQG